MRLIAAGDRAVLARTGARLSPGAYRRALRLWRALRTAHVPGVMDLVLAYASVLVHFDPLVTNGAALAEQIRAVAATEKRDRMAPGRLVTLPVRYGGANGPDLAAVAAHVGLTPDEVVRLHAHPLYRVYFLGFTAGFPYLAGLPPALASPRLNAPRTRVPAGSVGIAGQQTGVYPAATPGGWRLIGRTSACLFDPSRDPPALLHPGDRVRFRPIAGTAETASADQEHTTGDAAFLEGIAPGVPWLRVIQPGPLTTVQDLGRPGYAAEGVAAGGAVDRDALRLGNLLLGNPPGAAALEITLGAATFEALAPCAVAVTGADCALRVAGQPIPRQSVALVPAGARIEVDRWRWGARAYLCVEGGVAVPLVLGSRSTDLRAGMGGLAGRALRPGDEMRRAATTSDMDTLAGRRVPDDPPRDERAAESAPGAPGATILRMLPGPHSAAFPGDLAALLAGSYRVDVRADRMGARLVWDGPSASDATLGGEVLSEGVPDGAIQLPPDGQPILLLADHQTTGGYRVPAVVVSADQARAAQLRPGDAVRFALTTPHQALAALHARADWFTATTSRLGWATQDDRVTIELLMGGFAEWSEETSDDE